jgi:apolipoprotein N-acyltransferase
MLQLASVIGLSGVSFANPAAAGPLAAFYRARQQQNGGAMLLGPIQLSRQRLRAAVDALSGEEPFAAALAQLRSASLQ